MRILTVFTHHNHDSFCGAILEHFDEARCRDPERVYPLGREF